MMLHDVVNIDEMNPECVQKKRWRFGCKRDLPNDGVLVHSQNRLTGWSGVCGRFLRPLRDQSVAGKFCKSSFQLPGASWWGRCRWRERLAGWWWWWWWWCDPLKDIILCMCRTVQANCFHSAGVFLRPTKALQQQDWTKYDAMIDVVRFNDTCWEINYNNYSLFAERPKYVFFCFYFILFCIQLQHASTALGRTWWKLLSLAIWLGSCFPYWPLLKVKKIVNSILSHYVSVSHLDLSFMIQDKRKSLVRAHPHAKDESTKVGTVDFCRYMHFKKTRFVAGAGAKVMYAQRLDLHHVTIASRSFGMYGARCILQYDSICVYEKISYLIIWRGCLKAVHWLIQTQYPKWRAVESLTWKDYHPMLGYSDPCWAIFFCKIKVDNI